MLSNLRKQSIKNSTKSTTLVREISESPNGSLPVPFTQMLSTMMLGHNDGHTETKDDVKERCGGRCLRRSGDMHLRSGESARLV